MRIAGTVKFFSDDRGYGFIMPDGGGVEVFVHRTNLSHPLIVLRSEQRVTYELAEANSNKGNGKKAVNVELAP